MEAAPLIILFIILFIVWIINANINSAKEKKAKQVERERQEQHFVESIRTLQDAYNLKPVEFEFLIKKLFEKLDYSVQQTPLTGDGGIDLFLLKEGKTELVQCKRFKGNISVQPVREFYGVMVDKRVQKGYIVTTGHFTLPARRFAEGKGIHLIDGSELAELLMSNNIET